MTTTVAPAPAPTGVPLKVDPLSSPNSQASSNGHAGHHSHTHHNGTGIGPGVDSASPSSASGASSSSSSGLSAASSSVGASPATTATLTSVVMHNGHAHAHSHSHPHSHSHSHFSSNAVAAAPVHSQSPPQTSNAALTQAMGSLKVDSNAHVAAPVAAGTPTGAVVPAAGTAAAAVTATSAAAQESYGGHDDDDGEMGAFDDDDDDEKHSAALSSSRGGLSTGALPPPGLSEIEQCNLFVGDLARTCSEEQLRSVFAKYGDVMGSDVKRDKVTGNNLGYGFVQLKTKEQAIAAKNALDGTEICQRKVRIGWAQKNTTLFIGDLDGTITTERLKEVFGAFGALVEEESFVKGGSGKFGFVRFVKRMDAERAKTEMNRKVLGTRPIRIGWGDNTLQKHCVHVMFNPAQQSAAPGTGGQQPTQLLTDASLKAAFEQFGAVVNVSLPRYVNKRLKGYGFIHYQETDDGEKSAQRAISALNDAKLFGSLVIRCSYGKRQVYRHRRNPRYVGMAASAAAAAAAASAAANAAAAANAMALVASGGAAAAAAAAGVHSHSHHRHSAQTTAAPALPTAPVTYSPPQSAFAPVKPAATAHHQQHQHQHKDWVTVMDREGHWVQVPAASLTPVSAAPAPGPAYAAPAHRPARNHHNQHHYGARDVRDIRDVRDAPAPAPAYAPAPQAYAPQPAYAQQPQSYAPAYHHHHQTPAAQPVYASAPQYSQPTAAPTYSYSPPQHHQTRYLPPSTQQYAASPPPQQPQATAQPVYYTSGAYYLAPAATAAAMSSTAAPATAAAPSASAASVVSPTERARALVAAHHTAKGK